MPDAAEPIISDKARIARILNSLKNYPFYTRQFVCERIFNIDVVYAEKIEAKGL